jgi:hypothetical protein
VALTAVVGTVDLTPVAAAFAAHVAWWQNVWRLSYLQLTGISQGVPQARTAASDRAAALSRVQEACETAAASSVDSVGHINSASRDSRKRSWPKDVCRANIWLQKDRLADITDVDLQALSQNYALERYHMLVQGRGNMLIKFNGGLFTWADETRKNCCMWCLSTCQST